MGSSERHGKEAVMSQCRRIVRLCCTVSQISVGALELLAAGTIRIGLDGIEP